MFGGTALVGANVQDDDGLVIIAPSQDWVEIDFRPIAAVSTNSTNTTNINHLFIDPSGCKLRGGVYKWFAYRQEENFSGVCLKSTPAPSWG
jgi:hypothetical protein